MDKKWLIAIPVALAFIGAAALLLNREKHQTVEKQTEPLPETRAQTEETLPPLPDSVLYYGTVLEVIRDEEGKLSKLSMESPRDGAYVMNLGEPTLYVDSGEHKAFDPETLQKDDRIYVFHSPMVARSLPPQAAAFLIEKNIPMDASCGMYHRAEEVRQQGEDLVITIESGERELLVDGDTRLWTYEGEKAEKDQILEDAFVIAWYWDRGEKTLRCGDLMVLPK